MFGIVNKDTEEVEEIIHIAASRAANLYETHKLCCSESILVMINNGFGGHLSTEDAVQIGSGFCHGMGGSGCSCGALSGAVAALGLILGPHARDGMRKKKFQKCIRQMHDLFRERFRATCCRVLTKEVRHDKKAHHENCLNLTRGGAEIAARLLLDARPELVKGADLDFLRSSAYT